MTKPGSLCPRNPLLWVFVGLVRFYQRFISPALPRSCRYHPSCSQYAVDAFTQYGAVRGFILASWRLMRCNPFSYGGYDPVEKQTLFCRDQAVRRTPECESPRRWEPPLGAASVTLGAAGGRRRSRTLLSAVLLAVMLMGLMVFAASCTPFGATTTTTVAGEVIPTESTEAGATPAPADTATTTTVEPGQDAGFLAGELKPLQALFFWILEFLHDNLAVSWSWAIVLLTVIVRIVLVPLTWRQIKSMRAMQVLQPQVKALQEKYKDDRQLLNQKLMEFYRENRVSPFSSCLPLLLQMPVFIGLYYMLMTAGQAGLDPEVAGRWAGVFAEGAAEYPVKWLWIADVTQFDYLLMFIYIASQFLASWQMARKGGSQQKIIAYSMPIIVGIVMFVGKWPSGLFIYWVTSNLWTIAQQFGAERLLPAPVFPDATPATAGAKGTPKGGARAGGAAAGSAKPTAKKAGGSPTAKPGGAKTKPAPTGTSKTKPAAGAPKSGPGDAQSDEEKAAGHGPAEEVSGEETKVKPVGKTGGRTSGQKPAKQRKATGGQGQRANRGTGRPKGTR